MPGHHDGHGGHGGYGAAVLLDPALDCVDGVIGGVGADFGADYFHQQHPAQQPQNNPNQWNNPNLPVYGALDPRNPNYQENLYNQQMQQNQQAYGYGGGYGDGYGGPPYGGGTDPNAAQPNDQVRMQERQCKELRRQRDAAPKKSAQRRQMEQQLASCESQLKTLKAQFGQQGQWGQNTPTWNPPSALTPSGAIAPIPIIPLIPRVSTGGAPPPPGAAKPGPGQPGYIAPPTGYTGAAKPGPGQPGYIAPPTGRINGEFGIETSQHGEFARSYKPTFGSEFGCQTHRKMG